MMTLTQVLVPQLKKLAILWSLALITNGIFEYIFEDIHCLDSGQIAVNSQKTFRKLRKQLYKLEN